MTNGSAPGCPGRTSAAAPSSPCATPPPRTPPRTTGTLKYFLRDTNIFPGPQPTSRVVRVPGEAVDGGGVAAVLHQELGAELRGGQVDVPLLRAHLASHVTLCDIV